MKKYSKMKCTEAYVLIMKKEAELKKRYKNYLEDQNKLKRKNIQR